MNSSYMFVVSVKRRRTLLSGTGSVECIYTCIYTETQEMKSLLCN